jgi:hypothetical protein
MTKEAIDTIKKAVKNGQTEELYLDDINIPTISADLKKEIENVPDLMCLSLNNCNLTSLANFPNKTNLIRLELMENKFPAKELEHLAGTTTLQSLSLGSNKITTINDLAPLKKLENLIQLDLSETELSKTEDYRKAVFELLTNLQVLDNLDAEGNEYEYSSESEQADGEFADNGQEEEEDYEGDEDDDDEDGEDEDEDGEDDEEGDDGEEDDEDDEDDEDEADEAPATKRRR